MFLLHTLHKNTLITIHPSLRGGDFHIPSPASTLSELQPQNVFHVHPAVLPHVPIRSLLDYRNVPCPLRQRCLSQIYSTQVAKPKLKHAVLHFMTFSTPSPTTTYRTKLHSSGDVQASPGSVSAYFSTVVSSTRCLALCSLEIQSASSYPHAPCCFMPPCLCPHCSPSSYSLSKIQFQLPPPLTFLSSSSAPCRLGQVPFTPCNPA